MDRFTKEREQNTASFLQSYQIQKAMSTVSGFDESEDMETNPAIILNPQNSFDSNLQAGQIRLLSQLERITYVVLLRRWEKDSFVVMTFSHYDFPANDEEFKPEFDGGMYLNTLQVWNTRTLQDETLKKSWLIGELPASDCSDAWAFWEHLLTGRTLKPELLAKSGVPILEAEDPRIQYIREESAIFEELDDLELKEETEHAALPAVSKTNPVDFPGKVVDWLNRIKLPELWAQEETALAAGEEKHDIVVECHPYGRSEFVSIVFSPNEKELRVNIYTPDQSEPSSAFDSWELVSENGSVLGTLRNGFCIVHDLETFDGKCGLRDPAGKRILCFEKREMV